MTIIDWLRRLRNTVPALDDVPVLWLGDPRASDRRRVGAKAANLSRLADRWPVPPGFCLPVDLYRRLRDVDSRPAARSVRRLVAPAYRRLSRGLLGRSRVAVRSSAVDEDTADTSFAGQHDTVLNAVGVGQVADAVLACCASASSDRVRAYRDTHGLDDEAQMAVLVQKLVDADASAVVFSANPVNAAHDEIMINATWGLGEAVVAGTVTPDSYVVARSDLSIVQRNVADKDIQVVSGRRGTREVEVPTERRQKPVLERTQCRELARLAIDLERQMGWPVDLECAYRDGELHLLQCRPITALPTS